MATMAENVVAAGAENRPQMLEKGMYNSCKTRIWLYIKGKENGEILLDSINKGPFQIKVEITVPSADGTTKEKLAQTVDDLSPKEKLRCDSDIKAVNILLLGLPVDIYTLINHYQTVKEIWDRVKELMEGIEMTLQEHVYVKDANQYEVCISSSIKVDSAMTLRYPPINNQLRTSSNPRTQATIQNGQVMVQNVQGRQSQGNAVNAGKSQATRTRVINTVGEANINQPRVIRCYNCRGEGHMTKQCIVKKKVKDSEWFKEKMLLAQAQEAGVVLHEDQQDFLADRMEEMEDCEDL
ncbi:retrovirus-related pol polyprotein from transposon TNT 1-94 [Tanacetum coccineum]